MSGEMRQTAFPVQFQSLRPGMPVPQLGDVHAFDVFYAVERTTEVDEWLEVLTTDLVLKQHW